MQFCSWRIRLLIANLNTVTEWCAENIKILLHPIHIPQMKIKASQWTARFNMQRKPKECWCLLRNLSFGLFDHIKIPELFKVQNFSKIPYIPGLSRTLFKFKDWWEPGTETNDLLLFRLKNKFRKIPLLVMYYLTKFDDVT